MASYLSSPNPHKYLYDSLSTNRMPIARAVLTNLPQKPTNISTSDNKGLSVGATIGIGIGIALLVILGAIGAWIFVRRRRRTWAQKRREQGDVETKGDTPDVEIAKKIQNSEDFDSLDKEIGVDGAVEIGGGNELAMETSFRPGYQTHEMPDAHEPAEMGEGRMFAVELEGLSVPGLKGT
ncbi:hypothetical protein HBI56_075250 [Parastagonospora nodorum]|nr:hypothetical protein HBH52_060580 [Parastagonospora nodorum]KAH4003731.1 hypothetical protein HBI10_058570 [Parastagonospora nodorum]KAH4029053.1 hypothetical protein HBI13_043790 [Parastagonospora nodorum]KAH4037945.1 hypothetical protein HBI09_060970 [Parastagonospora nodorum]KAH4065852.1 hypothetical protein HBH50_162010 [Parastagonospora nodorum]